MELGGLAGSVLKITMEATHLFVLWQCSYAGACIRHYQCRWYQNKCFCPAAMAITVTPIIYWRKKPPVDNTAAAQKFWLRKNINRPANSITLPAFNKGSIIVGILSFPTALYHCPVV